MKEEYGTKVNSKKIIDNEDLLADNVIISDDVIMKHVNQEIHRITDISNMKKKPYYFMTDYFQPGFVKLNTIRKLSSSGQKYTKYNFILRSKINKKHDTNQLEEQNLETQNNEESNAYVNLDTKENNLPEQNEECIGISNLTTKLNNFKRGITNRVKYRMMIPQNYPDQHVYYLSARTIKLNNIVKLKNIIEYQNRKNNFDSRIISHILQTCKCKLLLKIDSFTVTHTNVYLNICLIRIFPENLDGLRADNEIYVFNELEQLTTKNINMYNNLNHIQINHRKNKKQVQINIMKALQN